MDSGFITNETEVPMSYLTAQQHALVAIGAALASNCIPCIKYHVKKGLRAGLAAGLIAEAIGVAETVRRVPAGNVRHAAAATLGRDAARSVGKTGCGGRHDVSDSKGAGGAPCCGREAES
jgi:4-carboxymuconolactone decarboxylase